MSKAIGKGESQHARRGIAPVSLAAVQLVASAAALAQEPAAPVDAAIEEVVVTGSRIARDGFSAPTPLSTVSAEEIQARSPTTLGDVLNQIPSFRATGTPNSSGVLSRHGGQVTADLRGLTATRTLVLVNNRRFVPSTAEATVDLKNIPTLLVKQAEVVTGGASAAWGSDAVAGVVNFILKDRIEGFESSLQYGESAEGDSEELRASFATGGNFGQSRGRWVFGVDYMDNSGMGNQYTRDWGQLEVGLVTNAAFATNGQPNFIITPGVRSANMTSGGLVTAGPLRGLEFLPNGTTRQLNFGTVYGTSRVGGDYTGENPTLGALLGTPVKSVAGLGTATFDLSDDTALTLELSFADSGAGGASQNPRDPGNLTIRSDNAYLPASVRALMATNNLQTLTVGRVSDDIGPIQLDSSTRILRGVLGIKGRAGSDWDWDAYYQYGRSEYDLNFGPNNRNQQNWLRAVDAVVNPANGQIVCRSTLTAPGNGCIPQNVFGNGSVKLDAYSFGSAVFALDVEQQVLAANLRGEAFSTWAGPISFAFGAEGRKESAVSRSDAVSQQPQPNGSIGGWLLGNQLPLSGDYDVWEVYAETVLPLAKDAAFARSLDVNAAIRHTDYTTSGGVDTWKLGMTWQPIDSLRVRATRSHDIRAPNLAELFQAGGSSNTFVFDPVLGGTIQIREIQQGNPGLKPERADSWTAGIVLTPTAIQGLNASIDWFDISIADAISTLGAPTITNRCFAGQRELCSNIVFNPNGTIAFVVNSSLNLSELQTSGVDFELGYRFPAANLWSGLGGDFSLRLMTTWLNDLIFTDPTGTQNRVAKMSNNLRTPGMPRWSGNLDLGYRSDRWFLNAQARFVGPGNFNFVYGEGAGAANTINDNTVPAYTYLNFTAQRSFAFGPAREVQAYLTVNNALDKDPPWVPAQAAGGINESSTSANFYDVVGRAFKIGVRVNF